MILPFIYFIGISIAGQVRHKQQKILPLNSSIDSIFYYVGNIVKNL